MNEQLLQDSFPLIRNQHLKVERVSTKKKTSINSPSVKTIPRANFSITLQSVTEIQKKYLPNVGSPLRKRI